ncbi:3-dehydroquinate synthase [Fervidobacterium pennivorans subsp. carthaginiensis]|uniref:3-dehydroquinate synthase n=1 Tax=Fervidobacterium pennivorans TaxID=93466 RepID=UPI00355C7E5E
MADFSDSINLLNSSIVFFDSVSSLVRELEKISKKVCVIVDEALSLLYSDFLNRLRPDCTIVLRSEESKSLEKVARVYERFIECGVDRSWYVLGIGGGVVSDITGFVASTYMRGLRFGFVPTTLLAMVDAAIGGKNGVNLGVYKNIVGTVNLPEFVYVSPEFLKTLPDDEFRNGLAEVVKAGVIGDRRIFEMLEDGNLSENLLEIVRTAVQVKVKVVSDDLHDNALRKILNFGHTVGHAIELKSGLKHGYAVSVGMVVESVVGSVLFGMDKGIAVRIANLLRALNLPVGIKLNEEDIDEVLKITLHDKKSNDEKIDLVSIREIGKASVVSVEKVKFLEVLGWVLRNQISSESTSVQV